MSETKRDKRKKFNKRLPNKLLYIPNPDKKNHEHWYPKRNLANLPRPFRALFVGSVNSSKTNTAKNLVLRAFPRFENIILIHCNYGEGGSKEWDDIGITDQFEEIPDRDYFNQLEGRTLVILEDVEFQEKDPSLSLLFRHLSTHFVDTLSVMLLYQDFIKVPKIARRLASQFIMWKLPDQIQMNMVEKRVGMKKGELIHMFDTLCKERRDSIMIDLSDNSPAPLRLNVFQPIRKIETK
jgi:hypothetical protein